MVVSLFLGNTKADTVRWNCDVREGDNKNFSVLPACSLLLN